MAVKYGKTFTAKKGKHRGKRVRYSYKNGRKSTKKMVLAKKQSHGKRRSYRGRRY